MASFRNQSELLHKTGVRLGYEVENRDLRDRYNIKEGKVDRCIVLGPMWPRYIFDAVRLATPWLSRSFTFYGPVDGPFLLNVAFFKVLQNSFQGSKLTTTSQWCMDQINQAGSFCSSYYHHGIDLEDFKFSEAAIQGRLRSLRMKWKDRTIFFSNINPLHRKGFDHLVKAIRFLNQRRAKDYVFVLHTGRKKALQICAEMEKIPNLVIEDAYNRLPFRQIALKTRACDCFVFPSLLEGFGLPVLEAAASGRPIICGDFPPLTEIVNHECAYLLPISEVHEEKWQAPGIKAQLHKYDPEYLGELMEYVMDNPEEAREKGEKALERAQDFEYFKRYEALVKGI